MCIRDRNTTGAKTYFTSKGLPDPMVKVVNVDQTPTVGDGFDLARGGFAQAKAAVTGGASAVAQAYHGSLVPPFCNAASKGYFDSILLAASAAAR